ncbi:MAG: restriction endonuclease subunit S, partial [Clostridiales bacterium]|nr:restriction endonuclease subunit S [Clostridiales bacterium]
MEVKKLKECCTIIAGQSPESKYYNSNGDGLPFFQGKADFGELYPSIRVYCSQPTKIAEKDDILLSVRAPVGPTNLAPCKVCIGRGLTAIRPSEVLLTRYVLLFFRYFEAQLASKGTGTTFKAITQDVVKNLEIPIPPLPEQERIVARIEELFSQLDAGVETLKKTKAQLVVYRQAVLKEAFEGDYPRKQLKEFSKAISGFAFKSSRYSPDGNYVVV